MLGAVFEQTVNANSEWGNQPKLETIAMKKLLLASVAAVALSAFAVGQAAAADANDGLKLGLGGYHSVHGAFTEQDDGVGQPGANTRDFDIFSYGEINLTAEKTFDNGLTVGYKAVTPVGAGAGTDNFNENFGYFSGYWGRAVAGQDYSPLYYMTMGAPVVDAGIDGTDPDFNFVNIGAVTNADGVAATNVTTGNANTVGFRTFEKTGGDFSDKVAYYTPRFNGFQFGASYAPEFNRTGGGSKTALGGQTADNTAGQQSERMEIAGNYEGSFWNGVGVKVGGGYGHSNLEAEINGTNTNYDDQTAWNAGAQFAYMGWTFGGGYIFDDNGNEFRNAAGTVTADGETDAYNLGVTYDFGPYRAGVSYLNKQTDVVRVLGNTISSTDEFERWVVAGAYKVAPGVDLGATLQFHDYSTDANTTANPLGNNNATVFTVGTTMNF
jgi:outer membrane protein OmpU